jgi:hypothetical protein
VAPTVPTTSPAFTASPVFTAIDLRWQTIVNRPLPWSIHTVLPLKK